ncbi:hypothetical protein M422DRAFT_775209, partial [Sphaerobolus stellatus SS14]
MKALCFHKDQHQPLLAILLQQGILRFIIIFIWSLESSINEELLDMCNLLVESESEKRDQLIREATGVLKRAADRGHTPSQYLLADRYANGLETVKSRQDFDRTYPLFVLAAKHNHAGVARRHFYRKAAAMGACYRLGVAELNGELDLNKSPREGISWLKRSAECATAEFPHALHELALLHERGIPNVIFKDEDYAVELLVQAAELENAPSATLQPSKTTPTHASPSQRGTSLAPRACSPSPTDTESYLWAKKAADQGLVKALYTPSISPFPSFQSAALSPPTYPSTPYV